MDLDATSKDNYNAGEKDGTDESAHLCEDFKIAAEIGDAPLIYCWFDCNEIKAMADVVEATLGAIFVDAGFDFNIAWYFF